MVTAYRVLRLPAPKISCPQRGACHKLVCLLLSPEAACVYSQWQWLLVLRVARFAASLLAPLVESYAISVETACEVLGHGNEAATATVAELASAVEHNLLRHSQVPASLGKSHVVPSVLLAKVSRSMHVILPYACPC